jgi:molecular chaperone GrpE
MAEKKAQTTPARQQPGNGQAGPGAAEAQQVGNDQVTPEAGEVAALRARVEAAEKARDEFQDLALRTRADFENYQKRNQRDLANERMYAQTPLAGDLLPALDNLDRALAAARQAGDNGALVQGVALVQNQLLDILRRHGITRIDAQGKPFDPNLHQAVLQQPSAEVSPGTVLQVLEQGYTIHERVLRPARVIVSTAPASK